MLKEIIELHSMGLNDREIGEKIGISQSSVHYKRHKILKLPANFSYTSMVKIDENILKQELLKGTSLTELAKIFNCKVESIWFAKQRYNIPTGKHLISKNIPISSRQEQIIIGCVLGDGTIFRRKETHTPYFSCEHSLKQKEYNYWKYKELKSLNVKYKEQQRKTIDERTGIYYSSCVIKSPCNPAFIPLYENFYINNKKRITTEILSKFTSLSLAIMYMDDGCYYKATQSVSIATHCFLKEDVELFVAFCKEKWELPFTIHKTNGIYLPKKYFSKFKQIIQPYMHSSMLYKIGL